jgi:hypothetical protein
MKIQREFSNFETADTRDTFHYTNYCALLACILNENLSGDQAISRVLGSRENDSRAGRRRKVKKEN